VVKKWGGWGGVVLSRKFGGSDQAMLPGAGKAGADAEALLGKLGRGMCVSAYESTDGSNKA
jgi:hypothetical protein